MRRALGTSALLGALLSAAFSGCTLLVDTTALSSSAATDDDEGGAPDAAVAEVAAPVIDAAKLDAPLETSDGRVIPAGAALWALGPNANGHYYEIVVSPGIGWLTAKAEAALRGGHLATISSKDENDFVAALALSEPAVFKGDWGPWLGAFQPPGSPEPAGGFTWVTGEPFVFTNWAAPGEPSNTGGESVIGFYQTPRWGDYKDSVSYANGYVVEYE